MDIGESSTITLSLRTFLAMIVAIIGGIWVTALFYLDIRNELRDLKHIEYWTLTDMERYSYRLGDMNRDIIVVGGPFRVPDPITVREQRTKTN